MRKGALALLIGAMVVPAIALARAVKPSSGTFKATLHYKVAGTSQTGDLQFAVAKSKVMSVSLAARKIPLDAKHSHGQYCGSASMIDTMGFTRSGTTSASGQFNYTFTQKYTGGSVDRIYLIGRFTTATRATGTYRYLFDMPSLKSHCDGGVVPFPAALGS